MTKEEAMKILERIQDESLTQDAFDACEMAIEILHDKIIEEKGLRLNELNEELFRIKIDSDFLSREDWKRIDEINAEIKELTNGYLSSN